MNHLVDKNVQMRLAKAIDSAVEQVLAEITMHGNEEGLTAALGHALSHEIIKDGDLEVNFKYRQHNKITEENTSGSDGNFLVRVSTPDQAIEKASLFQAKLVRGEGDIRGLRIRHSEAMRLKKQSKDMLKHTSEAVAVFYTHKNVYVVDAGDYSKGATSTTPLAAEHRLITLGTYLGKWMPRCTKGEIDTDFVKRAKHEDGFKHGLTMNVITIRPSVPWIIDKQERDWRVKT